MIHMFCAICTELSANGRHPLAVNRAMPSCRLVAFPKADTWELSYREEESSSCGFTRVTIFSGLETFIKCTWKDLRIPVYSHCKQCTLTHKLEARTQTQSCVSVTKHIASHAFSSPQWISNLEESNSHNIIVRKVMCWWQTMGKQCQA